MLPDCIDDYVAEDSPVKWKVNKLFQDMQPVNIGELARRSGLTQSRIRFYESIGLLRVDRKPNGYRTYPAEALLVLDLIASAQRAGFSLEEIRALLPTDLDHWEHDALLAALRAKVADIEALEARLTQSKAHLVSVIADIEAKPDDVTCTANARRVLSRIVDHGIEHVEMAADDARLLDGTDRRQSIKSIGTKRAQR